MFDADGVLQDVPGGWYALMEPYLGDRAREFLHETWKDELPMLAGQGDYLPVLAATLASYGVATPVEEVYRDVWQRIEPVAESLAVVQALRANGYGVHLATNQEQYRAAYMRSALGYDEKFDVCCYSCDLGVAKPDPAFFAEAARRIGASPADILFIDDSARNVDGARTAGLTAEQWSFEQGHDVLLGLLAGHGVVPRLTCRRWGSRRPTAARAFRACQRIEGRSKLRETCVTGSLFDQRSKPLKESKRFTTMLT